MYSIFSAEHPPVLASWVRSRKWRALKHPVVSGLFHILITPESRIFLPLSIHNRFGPAAFLVPRINMFLAFVWMAPAAESADS